MRTHILSLLVFAAAHGACAPIDDAAQQSEQAIINGRVRGSRFMVVALRVGNTPTLRQAVLLSNDVAITSARWVDDATPPASVRVLMASSNGAPSFSTFATHVNVHPGLGLAVIRLATPVAFRNATTGFAARLLAAPPAVGVVVQCTGHVDLGGGEVAQRFVERRVTAANATSVTLGPPSVATSEVLEDEDAGIGCSFLDVNGENFVGFVTGVAAPVSSISPATLVSAQHASRWISDMVTLNRARTMALAAGRRPFRMNVTPDGATLKCADIAGASLEDHAGLNQFFCHSGRNQLFWAMPTGSGGFAIVNDLSGRCLDVFNGNTAEGARLQQFHCHFGANQTFTAAAWSTGSGQRIEAAHAPGRCLTVEAAAPVTRDGAPIAIRSCRLATTSNHAQRWGFEQR